MFTEMGSARSYGVECISLRCVLAVNQISVRVTVRGATEIRVTLCIRSGALESDGDGRSRRETTGENHS